VLFVGFNLYFQPHIIPATLIIRATGILGILMLHVILAIGPLARLNPYFLPLLYNRRHLGVSMFLISAVHGVFAIVWFHGQGNVNPLYSLFTSNMRYDSFVHFPFQVLGFFGLLILLLMAASSHDYWLKNLSPEYWKSLHMMVYIAYLLLLLHVFLGALQLETSHWITALFVMGMIVLVGLHLTAGWREARIDNAPEVKDEVDWVKVGTIDQIPNNRAKVVKVGTERIAVFKYEGKLSALSNVCKHQNGPLGEGKIIDGCITCPWHGYQYLPHNGQSPAPFTEKVATFQLKLVGDTIFVNPKGFPEGTELEPVFVGSEK
jgi:methionine sulfoxide reductase heme-binding subunit